MRLVQIGPKDQPIALRIDVHVEPGKEEIYRQVVMAAIRDHEKREPQPCHGCGGN